jgi:hypothetical protein
VSLGRLLVTGSNSKQSRGQQSFRGGGLISNVHASFDLFDEQSDHSRAALSKEFVS